MSEKEKITEEQTIKRLECLNLRLRIGMLQVGMESMQKDFSIMQKELTQHQNNFGNIYAEFKETMNCPEDQEINLETGEFVTPPQPMPVGTEN